ncbi:hypothetical protein QUB63_34850 [Microcoleus sp. ARI1-B5]|uniref:hypothetical protein n=1 Tax=unclassified Microcoleus TaxID=2642155 RepID=UPI002FCFB3BE
MAAREKTSSVWSAINVFARSRRSRARDVVDGPCAIVNSRSIARGGFPIEDTRILGAAVLANVDRLLSLNTKNFTAEVAARSGLMIQTPAEFVREIPEIVEEGLL